MANFPSVTAAGAFESPAVQNAIKALARTELETRMQRLETGTGWRNITLTASGSDRSGTGTIAIKRVGDTVRLRFSGLGINDGSGAALVLLASEIPTGFGSLTNGAIYPVGNATGNTTVNFLRPNGSLYWVMQAASTGFTTTRAGVALTGEMQWSTDQAFPTTFPGTTPA